MAFPDDYRRVQQAGGNKSTVDSHLGIPRQIIADTESLNFRLMDGVTPGGHEVAMVKDLPNQLQTVVGAGEVNYVEDPTTNDPDQKKLLWRSGVLRNLFLKLADMTDPVNWLIKDSALRSTLRRDAELTSDANLAIVSGFYRFNPQNTSNIPGDLPTGGSDQYMMFVVRQSSSELSQMIISRNGDGKIWLRARIGGVWQAWALSTGVTAGDLLTKVSKAGDTMTGKLIARAAAAVVNGAQLNLPDGVDPDPIEDGDLWRVGDKIRFRRAGQTVELVDSSTPVSKKRARIGCMRAAGSGAAALGVWGTAYTPYSTVAVRAINTEFEDPSGIVSLASNVFTLTGAAQFKLTIQATVSGYSDIVHDGTSNTGKTRIRSKLLLYSESSGSYVTTGLAGASALEVDELHGPAVTISGYGPLSVGSRSNRIAGTHTLIASVPAGSYSIRHFVGIQWLSNIGGSFGGGFYEGGLGGAGYNPENPLVIEIEEA